MDDLYRIFNYLSITLTETYFTADLYRIYKSITFIKTCSMADL